MSAGERQLQTRAALPRAALNVVLGVLLGMLAVPAFALGLGQIQVKSRPGEPLLAEIPIVSSDPTELQGLQARLASPETFRRIGLEPPQGIVSDLQFTPAVDERGRPVIRVTSTAPVQQAGLTFLIEVDWGQGRLVREYSALVDAPRTVAAPPAPSVAAPDAAPVIQRPAPAPAPPVATEPAATPAAPAPLATPAPQPEVAASPPPPAAPRAENGEYGPVKRGDTLARIAGGLAGTQGYSLDQTMLALLQANPEAFIGKNINLLKQGAVLRIPRGEELSRYSAPEAANLVRQQVASWREARRAQAQAATPVAADAQPARAAPTDASPAAPRRVADARLEIAPPAADAGDRAGTQSGASAGGEGEMLRQELQETKETLAARNAEVQELKARVAELEQLQKEQQSLIAMKDGALASAQQRLATTNATQDTTPPATGQPEAASSSVWWWLLPVALLLGALAWWFARRRPVAAPPATRISERFAAVPAPAVADEPKAETSAAAETPASPATPVWAGRAKPPVAAQAPATPAVGNTPTWMAPAGAESGTMAPLNQAPGGRERIELARAYADLGDRATARSLLQEVIEGGDAQARDEAAGVLQSLG
jgi:pilus assembly protein FimV